MMLTFAFPSSFFAMIVTTNATSICGQGGLLGRAALAVDNATCLLTFYPVAGTDEGLYRCEVTYLDIHRGCPVVQVS